MGDVQRDILRVLLKSLYDGNMLSKSTYESTIQLVQSTTDFPAFFTCPVCCPKEGEENGCTQG